MTIFFASPVTAEVSASSVVTVVVVPPEPPVVLDNADRLWVSWLQAQFDYLPAVESSISDGGNVVDRGSLDECWGRRALIIPVSEIKVIIIHKSYTPKQPGQRRRRRETKSTSFSDDEQKPLNRTESSEMKPTTRWPLYTSSILNIEQFRKALGWNLKGTTYTSNVRTRTYFCEADRRTAPSEGSRRLYFSKSKERSGVVLFA